MMLTMRFPSNVFGSFDAAVPDDQRRIFSLMLMLNVACSCF
jgi:hypothetical protein